MTYVLVPSFGNGRSLFTGQKVVNISITGRVLIFPISPFTVFELY